MAGQVHGIIGVSQKQFFPVKMDPIQTHGPDCVSLATLVDVVVIAQFFHISCVVEIHTIVLYDRGTGVDPVAVIGLIRHQRNALQLPVEHIPAGTVGPEFQAALLIEGGILIKGMVDALVLTESVRIVEPSHRRGDMKARAPAFRHLFRFREGLENQFFPGAMQCVHFVLSFSEISELSRTISCAPIG